MPRASETSSGAAGRDAVAVHLDVDFVDFMAIVRGLPSLARRKGHVYAMAFGRTMLRSKLALLKLGKPRTKEEARAMAAINVFFDRAHMRLLCDSDGAAYRCGTDFIEAVEVALFEFSVRAVFERSQAEQVSKYEPIIPRGT